MIDAAVRL